MRRLLVAGIGNIFRGDDAFGCEVVRALAVHPLPDAVVVKDFGIRGFDLACALLGEFAGAVLIDAMANGRPPGSLTLLEPDVSAIDTTPAVDPHGLTPDHVLRLVVALGGRRPWLRVVGCEPASLGDPDEGAMGLSDPVAAAVEPAVEMVLTVVRQFLDAG